MHRCTDALRRLLLYNLENSRLSSRHRDSTIRVKEPPENANEDIPVFSARFYAESTPGPRDTYSPLSLTCSSTKHRRLRLYRLSFNHNPLLGGKEADNDARVICHCSKSQPRLGRPLWTLDSGQAGEFVYSCSQAFKKRLADNVYFGL